MQGANFDNLTQLQIFNDGDKYVKSALLYGRNGSGKSTIAGAFRKIKGLPAANIQQASMAGADGSQIILTEEEKRHICVFDESFVNESVRIQEDGLGSIVMLGEQVGLAERIEAAEIELREAYDDYDQKKEVVNQYNDPTNQMSPRFYLKKIYSVLQNDDGWAGRKRIIDDLHRNASVSDNTYKKFLSLSPRKGRDDLIIGFKEVLDKLKQAKSGDSIISISVPLIPQIYRIYNAEVGNKLLKQSIEHPELTEREKKLLQLVQTGHGDDLKKTAQEFALPNVVFCPKCHQPLSEQYKNELIVSIEKVLSKAVEDHQKSLQNLLVQEITLDMSPFQNLPTYQLCVGQLDALNQMIQRNNNL